MGHRSAIEVEDATPWPETDPVTKRIIKMENALCSVIRRCNDKPSRALLDEIQQVALYGVGLQKTPPER